MEPWEQGTGGGQWPQCQVDKGHSGKVSEELLGLALKGLGLWWRVGRERGESASSKVTHCVGLRGVAQWEGYSRSVQGPGPDPQDTPAHTEEGGGYIPQRKEVS